MTGNFGAPGMNENLGHHMDWLRATLVDLTHRAGVLEHVVLSAHGRGPAHADPAAWSDAVRVVSIPRPTLPKLQLSEAKASADDH